MRGARAPCARETRDATRITAQLWVSHLLSPNSYSPGPLRLAAFTAGLHDLPCSVFDLLLARRNSLKRCLNHIIGPLQRLGFTEAG